MSSNNIKVEFEKSDIHNNNNITIRYRLNNFTEFFYNNNYYGDIEDINNCTNNTNDKIFFKDENNNSITYMFEKDIFIEICKITDKDVDLNFIFSNQDLNYNIYFGNYSYNEEFEIDYEIEFGLKIPIKSISYELLQDLNADDFNDVIDLNGFIIKIYNTTNQSTSVKNANILKMIQKNNIPDTVIYSTNEYINVQDKFGKREMMILNVIVW